MKKKPSNLKHKRLKGVYTPFLSQDSILNHKTAGFSMIELLVVIGILSILFALSVGAYRKWRNAQNFQSDQKTLVEAMKRARSKSKKESVSYEIRWASEKDNTYIDVCNIKDNDCERVEMNYGSTFDLKNNKTSRKFTYIAPFGRKDVPTLDWLIYSKNKNRVGGIHIYGVTGRVIGATCKGGDVTKC